MTIYKKDSSGKIRFLDISANGPEIIQESGVLGSENTIIHSKIATPKNIGKSNETSAEEQAILEVTSTITSKLKEGYFNTIEEAEKTEVILPMLAKVYEEEKHKIDWENSYVQPKFDGMRCLAFIKDGVVTLVSRKNRIITTLPHINEALTGLDDCILDGEIYNIDLGSFQNQMKAIKKYTKELSPLEIFNVYDIVLNKSFLDRFKTIEKIILPLNNRSILLCPTHKCGNEKFLKFLNSKHISVGFEGSMVRWGDEGYKIDARSSNLLKYKNFIDISLPIVDIIRSKQRPEWGQPIFVLDGKKFSAGMKYSHEERIDFFDNREKYIGKMAELRFFEFSEEGIPRFPIMHGIRLDK